MVPFSTAAYLAFSLSASEAKMLHHAFIEVDHVLLGLLKADDLTRQTDCPIEGISQPDWSAARREITAWHETMQKAGLSDFIALRRRFRGILSKQLPSGSFSGHRSDECRNLFTEMAQAPEAVKSGSVSLLLMGRMVFAFPSKMIDALLAENHLDRQKLIDALNRQMDASVTGTSPLQSAREKEPPETQEVSEIASSDQPTAKSKPAEATPTLDRYGRDLTAAAREGRLDPVIGRRQEIRKVVQTLLRRSKGNPLLVGDAGVGKTCIVEGLAQIVIEPDASEKIKSFRIIELNVNNLVSGTKYRGDFEEKLENILNEAASDPNIVLFIDEIHTLVGAGASGEGGGGAANVFKPALARGGIRCIGATTTGEFRRYVEKDEALTRRFQIVWIEEPSRAETVEILRGIRPRLEAHHLIKIPDAVIDKAVDLAIRYIRDFRLPDKALDILDQACAAHLFATLRPGAGWKKDDHPDLTIDDIARVVSERCKVPVQSLTLDEQQKLLGLEAFLKTRIFGQDEAVKAVSDAIQRGRLGLRDPRKPLAVMLFLGSTGTGKTETAKCLAEFLFDDPANLISIDMSAYQEKQDVAKLLGAPPGYIGHDEEGILFSSIRSHPYSVVLFDEVEKAAPEIFDIFLQIFDEGRLTDSHGRIAWFTESIIILTSNMGSRLESAGFKKPKRIGFELAGEDNQKQPSGGKSGGESPPEASAGEDPNEAYRANIMQAVNQTFRQEIIGRIQKKIFFYPLGKESQGRIVSRMLKELNEQLAGQFIRITLDEAAVSTIIDQGFNPVYGARSTRQAFDRLVTEPLTEALLSGKLAGWRLIRVSRSGAELFFEPDPSGNMMTD